MATKAQRFRRESERSKPKRKEGISQEKNIASKRKGTGRVKSATALTVRETMAQRAPSERAQRGRMPSRGKAPAR